MRVFEARLREALEGAARSGRCATVFGHRRQRARGSSDAAGDAGGVEDVEPYGYSGAREVAANTEAEDALVEARVSLRAHRTCRRSVLVVHRVRIVENVLRLHASAERFVGRHIDGVRERRTDVVRLVGGSGYGAGFDVGWVDQRARRADPRAFGERISRLNRARRLLRSAWSTMSPLGTIRKVPSPSGSAPWS